MRILSKVDLRTLGSIRNQLIEASKDLNRAEFDTKIDRQSKTITTMEWHTVARGLVGNDSGLFRLHWKGPSQEGVVTFQVNAIDGEEPKIAIISNQIV